MRLVYMSHRVCLASHRHSATVPQTAGCSHHTPAAATLLAAAAAIAGIWVFLWWQSCLDAFNVGVKQLTCQLSASLEAKRSTGGREQEQGGGRVEA